MMRLRSLAPCLAVLAACDEPTGLGAEAVCSGQLQRTVPVYQPVPVDLLFVIDRTPSMADERERLVAGMSAFVDGFRAATGAIPDLHVGVVSSDLGGLGVPGCSGGGDRGSLLGGERCGLDAPYLAARELADGTMVQNFEGDLGAAVGCMVDLAPSSCPVSQPIAAMHRVLFGPAATGFLRRPQAMTIIVFVGDGDDCSLSDPAALSGITGTDPAALEAAVDHACFARGALCVPEDPAAPGIHGGCTVRGDRGLYNPVSTATLIREAEDVASIVVLRISGGRDVEVIAGPQLAPSCTAPDGSSAGPAPRLAWFTELFIDRNVDASVCGDDWQTLIAGLHFPGPSNQRWLGCLEREADLDPTTAPFELDCIAELSRRDTLGDGDAFIQPIVPCGTAPPGVPCISFGGIGAECPEGPSVSLSLGDFRSDGQLYANVFCRTACEPVHPDGLPVLPPP